jgi:outer membrane protein, heavy metal efflux system
MLGTFAFGALATCGAFARPSMADEVIRVSRDDALRAARRTAPDLVVARAREFVARADVGVAGVYPNPTVAGASATQAAKVSATLSLPLVILGQRGAAVDAARAEQATVLLDTESTWNDVRQATERAYDAIWLAEGLESARRESAGIEAALESSVFQRVEVGSAAQIDALRVHAEKLRADADVLEAAAQIAAAASDLGRWMGISDGGALRARDAPAIEDLPPLAMLIAGLDANVAVRRERADARAAEARAARERALVRPGLTLDVGFDALDPTLSNVTNYRAQVTVDVPLFNRRGPYIDREIAIGDVARARAFASRVQAAAALTGAYRALEAATGRAQTLAGAVVPAAEAAARATEEAYGLGRAPLVAVLDAQRAWVDARLSALQAKAAQADAWADVEHSVGGP